MIRAIFFDCFGVLYIKADRAYFSRFPQHYDELHDLNNMSDHGFIDRRTYIESVARVTGVSVGETEQAFASEHILNRPLIDYIQKSLKPHYKIILLSNVGRGWIHDFFDTHQLHDLFDLVVMSSEEGVTKPNPLLFERAAQRAGVLPEECVMIDDHQENCDGAQAAGMQSLRFTAFPAFEQQLKKILR